jgi:hypothetical protein
MNMSCLYLKGERRTPVELAGLEAARDKNVPVSTLFVAQAVVEVF